MNDLNRQIDLVQQALVGEFFRIMGFSPDGLVRKLFGRLLGSPTRRFSQMAVEFDQVVADRGISEASRIFLNRLVEGFSFKTSVLIPEKGGLIVVSNHPGTFDLFCVLSCIPRNDIKFIISGVPVVRSLPAASEYLIYVPGDAHGRIQVVRSAIRHLNNDGCLVLFPSGILDPDPEIMPGASGALDRWSRSLDMFLRQAPQACIQVAIVSGVLPENTLKNPLTILVKEEWKKQRLAEFLYIAKMMVRGGKYSVRPKISFAKTLYPSDFGGNELADTPTASIIQHARDQLMVHCDSYPCVVDSA